MGNEEYPILRAKFGEEYVVLIDSSREDIIDAVNEKLEEGWKLVGGISISNAPPGSDGYIRTAYAQAMVKNG